MNFGGKLHRKWLRPSSSLSPCTSSHLCPDPLAITRVGRDRGFSIGTGTGSISQMTVGVCMEGAPRVLAGSVGVQAAHGKQRGHEPAEEAVCPEKQSGEPRSPTQKGEWQESPQGQFGKIPIPQGPWVPLRLRLRLQPKRPLSCATRATWGGRCTVPHVPFSWESWWKERLFYQDHGTESHSQGYVVAGARTWCSGGQSPKPSPSCC